MNYYNDNSKESCAWIRELIKAKLTPAGDIDGRSITDVQPADLKGYTQCHFFAGIGGWSRALQLADWPEDEQVWTGSCPCQPFSIAGRGRAAEDPRHLWPQFRRLVAECGPSRVFGEQVAGAAGLLWLSGVRADLEDLGYQVGAADLCAAGVGAPHIRQRLYWVANSNRHLRGTWRRRCALNAGQPTVEPSGRGDAGRMADAECQQHERRRISGVVSETTATTEGERNQRQRRGDATSDSSTACTLANTSSPGLEVRDVEATRRERSAAERGGSDFWDDFRLIPCTDGKARRVEPSIQPLAHGFPGRVGILRGAGNAIVPEVADEFIKAFIETQLCPA